MKSVSQRMWILPVLFIIHATTTAQWGSTQKGPDLQFTIFTDKEIVAPNSVVRLAINVKMDEPWHINSNKPLDEFLIPTQLKFEENPHIQIKRIIYPPAKMLKLSFSDEPLSVFETQFYIGIELETKENIEVGKPVSIKATLHYQACDDKQCLPPNSRDISIEIPTGAEEKSSETTILEHIQRINWESTDTQTETTTSQPSTASPTVKDTSEPVHDQWEKLVQKFTIVARLDGYANKNQFLKFINDAEKGESPKSVSSQRQNILWWLIGILIGGLALNLTPCVLPVIPLNIAIIGAGARAGSKLRGFLLGSAYGLGIALVYGALGVAVVLGISKTFGAINSTFWFNGIIAGLFLLLALAMFDVIMIDFSKYQAYINVRGKAKGSLLLALFMGGVSALLAGACVAPVVISTILHAQDLYSQGIRSALFLPLLLGVGMALPWPLLGAGLTLMPKPGKWTEYVKYAFGVILVILAGYYALTAYNLFTATTLSSPNTADTEGWIPSLATGLEEAQRTQRPVIVDFWATWCKNCIVMSKTVLPDPAVKDSLKDYVKVKFQAENPNDPQIQKVMEYFEVIGLPTFIIMKPKKE